MTRRKQGGYFKTERDGPAPLAVQVRHWVRFSEVDPMAIAWHGRYLQYFEIAAEALGRKIGLSYADYFNAQLRAPVVQAHVDYHHPVRLGEQVTIRAQLVWTEAVRLNTEYRVETGAGRLAATGYTVQMLTDAASGVPCYVAPPLLARCRARWRQGELP